MNHQIEVAGSFLAQATFPVTIDPLISNNFCMSETYNLSNGVSVVWVP